MEDEIKKAKEKAMSLLLFKDRTKKELEERLYRVGFNELAINEAIHYVESFGYINDARYAGNYIHFRKESKSKKEISYKLMQKGVPKDIIEEAFQDYEGDTAALRNMIDKRLKGRERHDIDGTEKQKLIAYLMRKGYAMHEVLHELEY